jgi:hypothetical protein
MMGERILKLVVDWTAKKGRIVTSEFRDRRPDKSRRTGTDSALIADDVDEVEVAVVGCRLRNLGV